MTDEEAKSVLAASTTAATSAAIAAAKSAADVVSATMGKDISYIQKDISEMKMSLKEIAIGYVTVADFKDHLRIDTDHENRLRTLEQAMWKNIGLSSTIGATVAIFGEFIIKTIFKI